MASSTGGPERDRDEGFEGTSGDAREPARAPLDHELERLAQMVKDAARQEPGELERLRAGVVALLAGLDVRRTEREGAASQAGGARSGSGERPRAGEPARELPIRTTHRTACVLQAIAKSPGSNNREVAEAAGLTDEGQTSKLLARLERRGLIENVGLGAAHGEPNAWLLTADGSQVVRAIGHGFAVGVAEPGRRRVRGTA